MQVNKELSSRSRKRPDMQRLREEHMSLLKKLAFATAIATVMLAAPAMAQTKIALVVKSLGNGFFDAANKGAQEAAKELGDVEVIYTGPTTASAEGQIEIINTLI